MSANSKQRVGPITGRMGVRQFQLPCVIGRLWEQSESRPITGRSYAYQFQSASINGRLLVLQKNGVPQGSVLASRLFSIQMTSLFIPAQSCLHADDLCIATRKQSFKEAEKNLGEAHASLTPYYAVNNLKANS